MTKTGQATRCWHWDLEIEARHLGLIYHPRQCNGHSLYLLYLLEARTSSVGEIMEWGKI